VKPAPPNRVSIGMPVYNGREVYPGSAGFHFWLRPIPIFELLISD